MAALAERSVHCQRIKWGDAVQTRHLQASSDASRDQGLGDAGPCELPPGYHLGLCLRIGLPLLLGIVAGHGYSSLQAPAIAPAIAPLLCRPASFSYAGLVLRPTSLAGGSMSSSASVSP